LQNCHIHIDIFNAKLLAVRAKPVKLEWVFKTDKYKARTEAGETYVRLSKLKIEENFVKLRKQVRERVILYHSTL
jgi:hypothetical protein